MSCTRRTAGSRSAPPWRHALRRLHVSPPAPLSGTKHFSDTLGVEVQLGGGYGLKTARYKLLESPTYGVAVEAYRYLASAEADLQWTPIYAKMNLFGKRILHHEYYVLAGAGVTLEESVFPGTDFTIAPTIPIGVGTRIWAGKTSPCARTSATTSWSSPAAVPGTTAFKQNVALTLGVGLFSKGSE